MTAKAVERPVIKDAEQATSLITPNGFNGLRKRSRTSVSTQSEDDNSDDAYERKRVRHGHKPPSAGLPPDTPVVQVPSEWIDSKSAQSVRFSPGAVMAMRLVDFQVSRDATYRFEPYLNMILGSNGSGKSTVVTAMFLLFQGRIHDLDRSSYADFVTFGRPRAVLSAVVRGSPNQRNHVIVLVIPTAKFEGRIPMPQRYVDGRLVSESDFANFVSSYHIQVNNLSQFLPQTRISSFAGLSPEDRLKSIEEAVGYDRMLDDHKLLASRGQELVEFDRDINLYNKRLEDLRQRQAELEGKLDQLGTMNEEKERIEYLDQVLKLAKYQSVEVELVELRESLHTAREDLRNFDNEHLQVRESIRDAQAEISEIVASFQSTEDSFKEAEAMFTKQQIRDRDARTNLRRQIDTINDLRKENEERASKIKQLENRYREAQTDIARCRKALNEKGDMELFAQQANDLRVLQKQLDEVVKVQRELSDEEDQMSGRLTRLNNQLQRSTARLRSLETAQTKERLLKDIQQVIPWDKGELEKAIIFVRRNKDRFKLPVIDPAIVSVDITDQRLVSMIASVIPVSHLFKFICQCREDMVTLTALAAAAEGVNVKAVLLNERPREIPEQARVALKMNGFEGVLSDGLSGPAPIIDFLKSLPLGRTPYSLTPCSEKSRRDLKASIDQFSGFVDPQMHYSFMQSRYGQRLVTEASHSVGSAPKWARFMLRRDTTSELTRVNDTIQSLQREISESESQAQEIESRRSEVVEKRTQVHEKVVDLNTSVNVIRRIQAKLNQSLAQEKDLTRSLQALKSKKRESIERSAALLTDLIARVNEVDKVKFSREILYKLVQNSQKRSLVNTRRRDLENKKSHLSQALSTKREACAGNVTALELELSKRQRETEKQHRQSEDAMSWLRSKRRLQEGVSHSREAAIADIEAEIGRRQSLLDMKDSHGESLAFVQQKLNNVTIEVQDLEQKLDAAKTSRLNVSSEIESKRKGWESALNEMVRESSSRFAAMFEQLQCRGSVSISKPDPLALGTWGLDVNVAFRPEEEPQKLSRNRQSGGERSVTTAVFLMSLQSMTRAPFRVLDEINQGMDKHNETRTMAFIVDNSCNRANGTQPQQYFVITPKLLFDMPYHHRMSINLIMSSDHIEHAGDLPQPFMDQEKLIELIEEDIESD